MLDLIFLIKLIIAIVASLLVAYQGVKKQKNSVIERLKEKREKYKETWSNIYNAIITTVLKANDKIFEYEVQKRIGPDRQIGEQHRNVFDSELTEARNTYINLAEKLYEETGIEHFKNDAERYKNMSNFKLQNTAQNEKLKDRMSAERVVRKMLRETTK